MRQTLKSELVARTRKLKAVLSPFVRDFTTSFSPFPCSQYGTT